MGGGDRLKVVQDRREAKKKREKKKRKEKRKTCIKVTNEKKILLIFPC